MKSCPFIRIAVTLLILALALAITSCPEEQSNENNGPYSVSYHANGADNGSVALDSEEYEDGAEVTVSGNTGSLEQSGYTFEGWSTTPTSGGTDYQGGETFTMGTPT